MATAVEDSAAAAEAVPGDVASWPYRFEIVALDALHVDDTYQRPLTSFWKTLVEKFNPALVGTLIVSERKNGSKSIIDGQTRWTAMQELKLPSAPCLIYEGLSKADEARLFADLQTQRRGMRTYHRFRADLIARKPRAVEISKVCTAQGFELGKEETPNTLQSISALEHCWKFGVEHLEDVLGVIRDSWGVPQKPDDQVNVSSDIIRGMSHFLRNTERVDMDRLVDRMQKTSASMLKHRASALREGKGGQRGGAATLMSEAILGEYMRRR